MQQPPPQSLTGMPSQAARPPVAQVKTQAAPVMVTEADRIAWMRRFLVALELWKKCLDSASENQEGERPHPSEAGQKRARESQKVEPLSKRQKEATEPPLVA